jgi:ABC-type uncharacterized transport system auxiliary subunit
MKAKVLKVSRNQNDLQIDVEVNFIDESTNPVFQAYRVFTFPVDQTLTKEKIENAIKATGKELDSGLKNTILKEEFVREEFQGKEIKI